MSESQYKQQSKQLYRQEVCIKGNKRNLIKMHNESDSHNNQMQEEEPYVGYVKDPDYYFDSYSHFSIHEEMLKDTIRTRAYMDAIMDNPHLFKDKIVMDIGSGTGVLSIFAAKCGAKHVYGIEKANIYLHSRNIIEENGLSDKITIINGLVQEITLPVDKVDIIISEWMGYFLLYQSMFDSVLFARDKWLREGGLLFPNKAKMYIAALDDEAYYKKKLNFWNNVHGIKMTCIKKWVLSQPLVDPIESHDILTTSKKFYDIDLEKVTKEDLEFNTDFSIKVQTDGVIHGFVTWFDTLFTHGNKKINLSTSPYKKQTHWKQTVFYIDSPFTVYPGDQISGNINVLKAKQNPRELDVCIEFKFNQDQLKKQIYRIS